MCPIRWKRVRVSLSLSLIAMHHHPTTNLVDRPNVLIRTLASCCVPRWNKLNGNVLQRHIAVGRPIPIRNRISPFTFSHPHPHTHTHTHIEESTIFILTIFSPYTNIALLLRFLTRLRILWYIKTEPNVVHDELEYICIVIIVTRWTSWRRTRQIWMFQIDSTSTYGNDNPEDG